MRGFRFALGTAGFIGSAMAAFVLAVILTAIGLSAFWLAAVLAN